MRNWLINTKPKQLEYYKDILIHAEIPFLKLNIEAGIAGMEKPAP